MTNTPILSILIPTRNREEYALQVINHILEIKDDRFEVVLYNNSDTNQLADLIKQNSADERLKYFYNGTTLSFVDNFSLGIGECKGEFISIIGDDDGINPLMLEVVEWAIKNGIDAITPSLQLVYYWPGAGVNSETGNGRLTISGISCKAKVANPKKEVIRLLKNGCQDYLSYDLAKAYHGLIRKSVLDEIKTRTGKYIGGLSPDIYLSIAASILIDRVLIIDYPLTISGICRRSGSADSATGRHTGELKDAPHLKGHNQYEWSTLVPPLYSVETIWADSALAALSDLNRTDLKKFFSIEIISAFCLKNYPDFKDIIDQNLANNRNIPTSSILLKALLLSGALRGPYLSRFKAIKKHLLNNEIIKVFTDIPNIQQALIVVQNQIQEKQTIILQNIRTSINS